MTIICSCPLLHMSKTNIYCLKALTNILPNKLSFCAKFNLNLKMKQNSVSKTTTNYKINLKKKLKFYYLP